MAKALAHIVQNEALSHLAEAVAAPERCSQPVIARLSGYVFGVGLEIALACDFRIAAPSTLLALPELRIGMIPGSEGTQRVARLAGVGRAKDMILRARRVGAEEARQWGLLTEVVPAEQLDQRIEEILDDARLPALGLEVGEGSCECQPENQPRPRPPA